MRRTYLEVAKVDLGGGGNHVCLVHPPEGNTVDLVGTGDQQQSARQLLQEHHPLACEATREKDEDGAGCDGGAELRGLGVFTALLGLADILSGVETGRLLGGDDARRAVLLAADRNLLGCGGLSLNGLVRLFEALVETAAGEDGGAGEAADAGDEFLAAGHLLRARMSTKNRGSPSRPGYIRPRNRQSSPIHRDFSSSIPPKHSNPSRPSIRTVIQQEGVLTASRLGLECCGLVDTVGRFCEATRATGGYSARFGVQAPILMGA